jgi:predicted RNase H-like HicB family nuclease
MSPFYVAILEANAAGEIFATILDLPGVNTSASTRAGALALAVEFANDYVRDLVNDGHPVPKARDIDAIAVDPEAPELGRALIPVEVPGKRMKVS